jgi:membrane protease YdiL (CAAX protease family)
MKSQENFSATPPVKPFQAKNKTRKILQSAFLLYFWIKLSIIISFVCPLFSAFLWKHWFAEKSISTYQTIFYGYPVLLGILFTFYNPRLFGWLPGKTLKFWKLFLLYTLLIIVPLLTFLGNGAETPYHGMSWQVFILAPIGEELIFRGAFFIAIYELLKIIYEGDSPKTAALAIIFSAICFGFWHVQNIMVEPDFTSRQIIHTTLIGLFFGHLRYKTESLYPCIFIHFLINLLATVS